MEEKLGLEPIIRMIQKEEQQVFKEHIDELQPYDLSEIYRRLPEENKSRYVAYLGSDLVVSLVQELENIDRLDVLERITAKERSYVLNHMDNDDLAELLDDLPLEQKNRWVETMSGRESETVQQLLTYPPETAGRIMTEKFIQVSQTATIQQAVQKMKQYASYSETINYLYVVDEDKRLVGVISHRDLIVSEPDEKVADIMYTRVISTSVETDQEQVARLIERYDFLAVPVVEENGRLVGIITVDDAMDVLIQEANEDFDKMSATGKDIDFDTKASVAAFKRLPWLLSLLFIGIVTGTIVSRFDETIQQVVALTYFMPMIAGMTGNTGTQSLALAIRGMTQRDIDTSVVRKLLMRELYVGGIIGAVCGLSVGVVVYVWQGSVALSLVVGASLFVSLLMGTLIGTLIPFLLRLFKVDPAVASGPLITTLNDVFSLCVYFGLATLFLNYLI